MDADPLVDRPAGATLVDRPAGATLVDRPAGATLVHRPAGATLVDRPAGATLVDRPFDATLFLRPCGPVTTAAFLAHVHAAAAALPGHGPLLNLCRDRYSFTVGVLATILAGRVSLLCGEPTPAVRDAILGRNPGAAVLGDADIPPPGAETGNPAIPWDRLVALVFTSGSTGEPVAHPKHWRTLVGRSRAAGHRFGLDPARPATIVGTVPPGHMYGFETTALLPLHAAAASWCGPSFFPADVAAALAACAAPRILVTTPLQLRTLRDTALPPLACAISATAPLDPALAAAAETAWSAPVLEIFGATECGSIASRRTTDGPDWRPYPGITLRNADPGVEVLSTDADPVPLADEIDLLPDGRFRLLGRRADILKLAGRRASVAGLNRILTTIDGVDDGIFVVPDDIESRSTARLLALVVAPRRSAPSILAELRGQLDPIFLPRRVIHVDALPRNTLGKLPRHAVLALLERATR